MWGRRVPRLSAGAGAGGGRGGGEERDRDGVELLADVLHQVAALPPPAHLLHQSAATLSSTALLCGLPDVSCAACALPLAADLARPGPPGGVAPLLQPCVAHRPDLLHNCQPQPAEQALGQLILDWTEIGSAWAVARAWRYLTRCAGTQTRSSFCSHSSRTRVSYPVVSQPCFTSRGTCRRTLHPALLTHCVFLYSSNTTILSF